MATISVRELDNEELEVLRAQADLIADSAPRGIIKDNTFIFWAGFDGTYNTKSSPAYSNDKQSTAIGTLSDQVIKTQNIRGNYYPGVGTPGTLPGSAIDPTDQSITTAELAYKEFAKAAYDWRQKNREGEITTMVAAYSRGAVSAAVFSQMLYEKGLVYRDENGSEAQLVPPGAIGISGGLLISPVTTGAHGNLEFPPNTNMHVVLAENEPRIAYTQNEYHNLGLSTAIGSHSDIGASLDNGIGGILLDCYTRYFRNTGLPINDPPENRLYNGQDPIVLHDQTFDGSVRTVPNMFKRNADSDVTTDMAGTPIEPICESEICTTSYENYKGHEISLEKEKDKTRSVTTREHAKTEGPDGIPSWTLGEPKTEHYNQPPNYAPSESTGNNIPETPEAADNPQSLKSTTDEMPEDYDEDYYMSYYPGR